MRALNLATMEWTAIRLTNCGLQINERPSQSEIAFT
jgi:hypothetical protein